MKLCDAWLIFQGIGQFLIYYTGWSTHLLKTSGVRRIFTDSTLVIDIYLKSLSYRSWGNQIKCLWPDDLVKIYRKETVSLSQWPFFQDNPYKVTVMTFFDHLPLLSPFWPLDPTGRWCPVSKTLKSSPSWITVTVSLLHVHSATQSLLQQKTLPNTSGSVIAPPVDFDMFTRCHISLIMSAWTLAGLLGFGNPKRCKNRATVVTTRIEPLFHKRFSPFLRLQIKVCESKIIFILWFIHNPYLFHYNRFTLRRQAVYMLLYFKYIFDTKKNRVGTGNSLGIRFRRPTSTGWAGAIKLMKSA